MELYAGMVENMDFHVGRLIDYLKKIGEYDNTIFIVFGDNGAEGTDLFKMIAGTPGTRDFLFAAIQWSQTHPNAWGDPHSYVGYGPMWAQVSMTPFSQYKGNMAEGGIRNALIVSGPLVKRAPRAASIASVLHVADIMPTLLEVAGASYPKSGQRSGSCRRCLASPGSNCWRARGSLRAQTRIIWRGKMFGNRAVRQGDWKLRWQYKPYGKGGMGVVQSGQGLSQSAAISPPTNPRRSSAAGALGRVCSGQQCDPAQPRVVGGIWRKKLPDRYPVEAGYPPLIYKRQFMPPTNMLADPKP